ncbi:MAG: hypothetical protein RLZZ627_1562 [Pseudomonadota bacterium]
MNIDTPTQKETSRVSSRPLVNNPVADSWQTRASYPVAALAAEAVHQHSLDLVGYTLNGRPLYRAWQLALLLGISPALLSTSFGAIPTNLRPFEIYDEDSEANAGRSGLWSETGSKKEASGGAEQKTIPLEELRRLAVLARTELSDLGDFPDDGWNELLDTFQEF